MPMETWSVSTVTDRKTDMQTDKQKLHGHHTYSLGQFILQCSFIVKFYSKVLCDNFQNCSTNAWHNFMRQFYSSFFSTDPLGVAPIFSCVSDFWKWCTLERIMLCYKTVG